MPPGIGYGDALRGPQQTPGINPVAPPMQGGQSPAMARPDPLEVQQAIETLPQNKKEQLAAELADKTPEEQEAFLANWYSDWTAMSNMGQAQMDRSDALRQETPQGRTTRNDVFRAANPLEFLSQGVNNWQQQQQFKEGQAQQAEALRGKQQAIKQYQDLYR